MQWKKKLYVIIYQKGTILSTQEECTRLTPRSNSISFTNAAPTIWQLHYTSKIVKSIVFPNLSFYTLVFNASGWSNNQVHNINPSSFTTLVSYILVLFNVSLWSNNKVHRQDRPGLLMFLRIFQWFKWSQNSMMLEHYFTPVHCHSVPIYPHTCVVAN